MNKLYDPPAGSFLAWHYVPGRGREFFVFPSTVDPETVFEKTGVDRSTPVHWTTYGVREELRAMARFVGEGWEINTPWFFNPISGSGILSADQLARKDEPAPWEPLS